jgi:probable addiction module antidote protein
MNLESPAVAADYLDKLFEEAPSTEDISKLLEGTRKVAEANGGVSLVAKDARVSREALYRALSTNGNPTLRTLCSVLQVMGMRLSVKPVVSPTKDCN